MRGPKPKPLHLRLLDGNANKRGSEANDDAALFAKSAARPDELTPPAHLHPRQQALWREVVAHLPGALRVVDLPVFAAYIAAVHTFEESRNHVADLGAVVKTKDGNWIQNPWLSVMNKQSLIIKAYAAELGLSPTARMHVKTNAPVDDNPFDDLKSIDNE